MDNVGGAMVGYKEDRKPTISQRLLDEKQKLESRLQEVNSALEILEKNPDVTKVIDTLSKVTYLNY